MARSIRHRRLQRRSGAQRSLEILLRVDSYSRSNELISEQMLVQHLDAFVFSRSLHDLLAQGFEGQCSLMFGRLNPSGENHLREILLAVHFAKDSAYQIGRASCRERVKTTVCGV